MARMNSHNRRKFYKILVARDGEECRICRTKGTPKTLLIDHIDNDNSNNDLSNLQLVCRRDNYIKNPRGTRYQSLERESESESLVPATLREKREKEPIFRHWLYDEVIKCGQVLKDTAIHAGAEEANLSQQTIRRYLDKLISPRGMFQLIENDDGDEVIVFNTIYASKFYSGKQEVKKALGIIEKEMKKDRKKQNDTKQEACTGGSDASRGEEGVGPSPG